MDEIEYTPLDCAYERDDEDENMIHLLRSYGGKSNYYNTNGFNVGKWNGGLNEKAEGPPLCSII